MTSSPNVSFDAVPQDCAEIKVANVRLIADPSGALWWPETSTLLVADLHLEKGSSYARHGTFLPPYDSRVTLKRLDDVINRLAVERVILLGDSFHDRGAADRMGEAERDMLLSLQKRLNWTWVTGNHDPAIAPDFGGEVVDCLTLGALTLRHEPVGVEQTGEVAGHLHPVARIVRNGRSLRRRCFVADDQRIIMPAFGAYTGGLNVCDPAFSDVFGQPVRSAFARVWMIGTAGVYQVRVRDLRDD